MVHAIKYNSQVGDEKKFTNLSFISRAKTLKEETKAMISSDNTLGALAVLISGQGRGIP